LIHHINIDTAGTHTCKVYSGRDSIQHLPDSLRIYKQENALILIDANVQRLYGRRLIELLADCKFRVAVHTLPSGETAKSEAHWLAAVDFCFEHGVNRKTPLLAIGGGVTGDLAGFVAASVMRGIPLIQVPTTLLAMVDSSIGGKTGINHPSGKNLIGSFYQPDTVIADTTFLKSLPDREWRCGMAEVIKYGAIADPDLFDIAYTFRNGYRDSDQLIELITRCANIKAGIVADDEKEAGKRAFLNFGHTFAHALESFTEFKRFSHGEAVYIGMVAALKLSALAGNSIDDVPLMKFADNYKLSVSDLKSRIPGLVKKMFADKKSLNNSVRVVMLKDYGHPYIADLTDLGIVHDAWIHALNVCD
jgi:3-dehydroquinate synthase